MKSFNYIYLLVIPLAYLLFWMGQQASGETAFFYGFAENKETEISHDQDVMVSELLVDPGEVVQKGQELMIVDRYNLEKVVDQAQTEADRIRINESVERSRISKDISILENEKTSRLSEIAQQMAVLKEDIGQKEKTYKTLLGKEVSTFQNVATGEKDELKKLEIQLEAERKQYDLELEKLKHQKTLMGKEEAVMLKKVNAQIDYLKEEKDRLIVKAPSDGIIGTIHVRAGEFVSSFNTLISFYERNPTAVKGYVHESMILEVQVGDSLTVSSINQPDNIILGQVIGLGTRIVEIPERLRKVPEHKTYGREVLISIPSKNPLLQKEKVLLNLSKQGSENKEKTLVENKKSSSQNSSMK